MELTAFELVRATLDDPFAQVEKTHGDQSIATIHNTLNKLSANYKGLGADGRVPLDYSDPVTRFAYVYTYVAAHSNWVYQYSIDVDEIRDLLCSSDPVRVTSLGGGPGTEMVGLLRACVKVNRKASLSCFLIDGEDGWAETWAEIDAKIGVPFKVSTSFRCIDVTKPPKEGNLSKAMDADLFVCVFFMSEIYSFRKDALSFFSILAETAKKGAIVLYIDNSTELFTTFARSIFEPRGFVPVHYDEKVTLQISSSEEKTDLGNHLQLIGRSPRLKADATCIVWKKT